MEIVPTDDIEIDYIGEEVEHHSCAETIFLWMFISIYPFWAQGPWLQLCWISFRRENRLLRKHWPPLLLGLFSEKRSPKTFDVAKKTMSFTFDDVGHIWPTAAPKPERRDGKGWLTEVLVQASRNLCGFAREFLIFCWSMDVKLATGIGGVPSGSMTYADVLSLCSILFQARRSAPSYP